MLKERFVSSGDISSKICGTQVFIQDQKESRSHVPADGPHGTLIS